MNTEKSLQNVQNQLDELNQKLLKSERHQVIFRNWKCRVGLGQYYNGNLAILLVDAKDGGPVATASINMIEELLEEGEIVIKNYSENEGIVEALVIGGIINAPHRYIKTNFVQVPVCYLALQYKNTKDLGV